MSDIKISIIMPVYKVEEYVGKAIESILAQTFTDFEFLIVDDEPRTEVEKSAMRMLKKITESG